MTCASCRVSPVVEISFTVAGRQVLMRSCSHCDTRSWESDGEHLALPNVLAMAAARR